MAILTYIDGYPLFSNRKEAIDYSREILGDVLMQDVHVHRYKVGPHNYRTGYMARKSHEDLMSTPRGSEGSNGSDPGSSSSSSSSTEGY